MTEFIRYPHTPHLAWLGPGLPRGDKVLLADEADAMLAHEVVVEEKLDGANLGISSDSAGKLHLQNRGHYLIPPFIGQFTRATAWVEAHQDELGIALGERLILFGEWCAARHSVTYDHLPDWFVPFDIYDRAFGKFWSSPRREAWVKRRGLKIVPVLRRGLVTMPELKDLVMSRTSSFGSDQSEGIVIRRDGAEFLEQRVKLVRPEFVQAIGEHWRTRRIEWNSVAQT